MIIKNKAFKDIVISKHALHRAKERIDLKVDINSLEFEFKLKELLLKAEPREFIENKIKYELVYNNKRFDIIASESPNKKLIINTIICKDNNKDEY